jgi:hypothetical protein
MSSSSLKNIESEIAQLTTDRDRYQNAISSMEASDPNNGVETVDTYYARFSNLVLLRETCKTKIAGLKEKLEACKASSAQSTGASKSETSISKGSSARRG